MTKLRISTIPDSRPVKLTIELPAEIHRDLLLYAELISGKAGETADAIPDAARLVPLMVGGHGNRLSRDSGEAESQHQQSSSQPFPRDDEVL